MIGISGLTDCFDGKIARRFDLITEWGKDTGPIADKLTLGGGHLKPGFSLSIDACGSTAVYRQRRLYAHHGGTDDEKRTVYGRCPVVWKGMYCIHLCNDIPSSSDTRDAGYGD